MRQITDTILMVRPNVFYANPETSEDNAFQHIENVDLTQQAQAEFDALASALDKAGVNVCVVQDTPEPETPDALFPNNRISFHTNGLAVLYPLRAPNRRLEHELDVLKPLEAGDFFHPKHILDYRGYVEEQKFLEGTGSLVLDRVNRIAYAALSPRTDAYLVQRFCEDMGYFPVAFEAGAMIHQKWQNIYHTNVMMSIGEDFAVVVADAIYKPKQRSHVLNTLAASGRHVIVLSIPQMLAFCANLLQLATTDGRKVVAISQAAFDALSESQRKLIGTESQFVVSDISNIEHASGGSVRCMLAEVFR